MKDYRYGPYDKLIEQRVAQMTFRDEFKPFVIDGLKRRAFQYDFTEAQVMKDLDRLSNSLFKITSRTTGLTTVGTYYPLEKRLNLNRLGIILQPNKFVYEDFMHELYHALSYEDGYDHLSTVNEEKNEWTYSLVEALVEGSSKATINRLGPGNKVYHNNNMGYFTSGIIPELLCATFGVNKQELFAHGIQDRGTLVEFLSERSGISIDQTKYFIDEFEMNLDNMHNALYGGNREKRKLGIRGKVIEDSMKRVTGKCLDMMEMINATRHEEDFTPETFEDMKFNYNKLLTAISKGCSYISANPLNVGFSKKRVMENFGEEAKYYKNSIIQTEYLLDFKKEHTIPDSLSMFEIWARHGTLHRITEPDRSPIVAMRAEKLGLKVPVTEDIRKPFSISKEVIRRNNPPEEKLDKWDNSFIRTHNLRGAIIMAGIRDRMEKVKLLFGFKPKLLNPGEDSNQQEQKEFDLDEESKKPIDDLVLSPEEQKRLEQKRSDFLNNTPENQEEQAIEEEDQLK